MIPRTAITPRIASLVLFIEGFVSISLQMIALRQIVPFVGHSINSTSVVITMFLAALAFGYRAGGRVTSGHANKLRLNLLVVAVIAGLGLSYVAARVIFASYFSYFNSTLFAVFFYATVVVVPIAYLLAQSVVLLIHYRQGDSSSQRAGDTFHLSTIGNVFGGLITTLVIMFYLGVGAAVAINAALLCVAYWLISPKPRLLASGIAVGIAMASVLLNVAVEHVLFSETTAYANYYTMNVGNLDERALVINTQNASRTGNNDIGLPYIEHIEDQVFSSDKPPPTNVLVLGAGGFTFGRGRVHSSEITFIDVDSQMEKIGDDFLFPGKINGRFVASDARAYLLQNSAAVDTIVLDVFSHGGSVPVHLLTVEFFSLVHQRLTDSGNVYMNFIGSDKSQRFLRGLDNTIRSVFAQCLTHKIRHQKSSGFNLVYQCQRSPTDEYKVIYTDNTTKAAVDSAK